jgi:protein-S-isoprenylcysteine O-methyltransferase Ste14
MSFWLGGLIADGSPLSVVCVTTIGYIYVAAALHEERKFANSGLAASYRGYASKTGMFVPRVAWKGISSAGQD